MLTHIYAPKQTVRHLPLTYVCLCFLVRVELCICLPDCGSQTFVVSRKGRTLLRFSDTCFHHVLRFWISVHFCTFFALIVGRFLGGFVPKVVRHCLSLKALRGILVIGWRISSTFVIHPYARLDLSCSCGRVGVITIKRGALPFWISLLAEAGPPPWFCLAKVVSILLQKARCVALGLDFECIAACAGGRHSILRISKTF